MSKKNPASESLWICPLSLGGNFENSNFTVMIWKIPILSFHNFLEGGGGNRDEFSFLEVEQYYLNTCLGQQYT